MKELDKYNVYTNTGGLSIKVYNDDRVVITEGKDNIIVLKVPHWVDGAKEFANKIVKLLNNER